MAITNTVTKTKFQLKYVDGHGTYTYSGLKNSGITDDAILATAQAFASVQYYNTEKIYKITDSILTEEEAN